MSAGLDKYAEWIARLREWDRYASLSPQRPWHPGLDAEIAALPDEPADADGPGGAEAVLALKAALHLWNDNYQAAHDLVQHEENPTAYALHGIVHRREGDFDNAKYWFRRTGHHPAYDKLQVRASAWLGQLLSRNSLADPAAAQGLRQLERQGAWNPYLFADLVAMQARRDVGDEAVRSALEYVQHLEWLAFMRYLAGRLGLDWEALNLE